MGTPPTETSVLGGWMQFRSVRVPLQRPLAASDLAFGHLETDLSRRRRLGRIARTLRVRAVMARAHRETRTVVVSYVPTAGFDLPAPELSLVYRDALGQLNTYLVGLGVLHDDRLRPLSAADLPPVIPILPTAVDDAGTSHGPSRLLSLRPSSMTIRTYDEQELEQARLMMRELRAGVPLAAFYEIVQRAGAARRTDRDREAVVDYATAGELFISAILGLVGTRAGMDATKLGNLLDGNFKDRCLHLARLLGAAEDPTDVASPFFFWWVHCYLQRNRIVHEGQDSMPPLSELARIGLVTLVVNVRERVRSDARFADIGPMIQWGYMVDETGSGESSYPDPLDAT
jgi:hypothetical protein